MGKGTVEALIREVIKGQAFFGSRECFTATARFLTSLQMSSVDVSVSALSLLWGELNHCAASCRLQRNGLCLEKLFLEMPKCLR